MLALSFICYFALICCIVTIVRARNAFQELRSNHSDFKNEINARQSLAQQRLDHMQTQLDCISNSKHQVTNNQPPPVPPPMPPMFKQMLYALKEKKPAIKEDLNVIEPTMFDLMNELKSYKRALIQISK